MNYKKILESIIDNLDEGIIITDTNANITFYKECNKRNVTGIKDKNPLGKNILEVFPHLSEENSTFYNVLKNKKPIINRVQSYRNHLGNSVSVVTSTIPILSNGVVEGAFEIFKDLTLVWNLSEKVMNLEKEISNSKEIRNLDNKTKYSLENILCKNRSMKELKDRVRKISSIESPVLIYGETGTGKELFVQAIHNEDRNRQNTPFIAQNCAALPSNLLESILFGVEEGSFTGAKGKKGLFEIANGGTIYLDEINSLELELQGKLLRVIQEGEIRTVGGIKNKKIDVRIIASTNENPIELIKKGRLRKDLYYRLNAIYLEIPPLRQRKEDIYELAYYYLEYYSNKFYKNITTITPSAMNILLNHTWPGNVRELKHTIESGVLFCEEEYLDNINIISYSDENFVEKEIRDDLKDIGLNEYIFNKEKEILIEYIKKANGNYSEAARLLKIPKQTLHNKIKKFNLTKEIVIK